MSEQPDADPRAIYRERAHLIAWLAAMWPSMIYDASGLPGFEDEWPIIYLYTPAGQMSWHLSRRDLDLFPHVDTNLHLPPQGHWDGHDTAEKYRRVDELTAWTAERRWPPTIRARRPE